MSCENKSDSQRKGFLYDPRMLSLRAGELIVFVLLFMGLLAFGAYGSSAWEKSPRCKPKYTKTITATERIRVYMYTRGGPRSVVFACHLRREREAWLGSRYSDAYDAEQADVKHIRIAGDLIAYEEFVNERSLVRRSVRVINLRTEQGGWSLPSGVLPSGSDNPDDGSGRVTDLEMSRKGNVAFIVRPASASTPDIYEVYKADDRAKGLEKLDAGSDIEPRSLAYSSGRIYWTKAGKPYSSTLR